MRATVPRHRWDANGDVTTGPLGGVAVWSRCRWCGQIDSQDRRRRLEACVGPPRLEPERPRGWWRRVAELRAPELPPEPLPMIAAPKLPEGAESDDRAASG